jgi:hypothetical protein
MAQEPGERLVQGDSSTIMKQGICLGGLANTRTVNLLCCYNIDNAFLISSPQEWPARGQHQYGLARLKLLPVVNDTAPPEVKLFEQYNALLAND